MKKVTKRKPDKPLKIDIPEDAALRAFLKTPPERKKPKKKAAKKRK